MRSEKIELLGKLLSENSCEAEKYYNTLENCNAVMYDYRSYMTTVPIDCDKELLRLQTADFDLCCALITMLLREDHFSNGSFKRRQKAGQVAPIIERMILLLATEK